MQSLGLLVLQNLSITQLAVAQTDITVAVFVPFAAICVQQPMQWDCLCAVLCLVGADHSIFRN